MTPDGQNAGAPAVPPPAVSGDESQPRAIEGSGKSGELTVKDHVDVYVVFRDYIKHEDTLIHHRITWLVTIQAFSVANFGILLQKWLEMREKALAAAPPRPLDQCVILNDLTYYQGFMFALAAVGLLYAAMGGFAVGRAMKSIRSVRKHYAHSLPARGFVTTLFPAMTDGASAADKPPRWDRFWGFIVYAYMPIFFGIFWSAVMGLAFWFRGLPWKPVNCFDPFL